MHCFVVGLFKLLAANNSHNTLCCNEMQFVVKSIIVQI